MHGKSFTLRLKLFKPELDHLATIQTHQYARPNLSRLYARKRAPRFVFHPMTSALSVSVWLSFLYWRNNLLLQASCTVAGGWVLELQSPGKIRAGRASAKLPTSCKGSAWECSTVGDSLKSCDGTSQAGVCHFHFIPGIQRRLCLN